MGSRGREEEKREKRKKGSKKGPQIMMNEILMKYRLLSAFKLNVSFQTPEFHLHLHLLLPSCNKTKGEVKESRIQDTHTRLDQESWTTGC